tara:strand:+ start:2142 stop:2516 length:375 start_codon:yes stop_codon:yes gene_type:complete
MKNALLSALICIPAWGLGQSSTPPPSPDVSQVIIEAYTAFGLESEMIHDLIMRVTEMNPEQAQEAMMPYLSALSQARETKGAVVMDERMQALFMETWGVTELQIQDLQKVAARFASQESAPRRQ